MDMKNGSNVRAVRKMKTGARWQTVGTLMLGLVLVLLVNLIAGWHFERRDLTRDRFFTLDETTHRMLDAVTSRVDIVVFTRQSHPLTPLLEQFAESYAQSSDQLVYRYVDPDRDVAAAEELANAYGLRKPDQVIFDGGNQQVLAIPADDMADIDYTPLRKGLKPRIRSFRGEQYFTSALRSLMNERRPVVGFLAGHGECLPDDFDRERGYSSLAERIRLDYFDVRTVHAEEWPRVKDTVDILVIAGPRRAYAEMEMEQLRDHMEDNGRLILLLDAGFDAGFRPFLDEWGLQYRSYIVVDPSRSVHGRDLLIREYGLHPVTRGLEGTTCVFYRPAALLPLKRGREAAATADRPYLTALLQSTAKGWGERQSDQRPAQFDETIDLSGPVPFGFAVQRGRLEDIDTGIRPARMLVVGDSSFLTNKGLAGSNADLFLNALNWMLDQERLIPMQARTVHTARLNLTRRQLVQLGWLVIVAVPLLVGVPGLWIRYLRKSS